MKIVNKYRTTLNSFLLLIYFISMLAGAIHHHHFAFSHTKSINTQSNALTQDIQIQSGAYYSCILLQNLWNLQTALVLVFSEHEQINDENIYARTYTSQFSLNQIHLTNNLLRAPPSLS